MYTLTDFGWTASHQKQWDTLGLTDLQPARVTADFGTSLKIALPQIVSAELSGKLAHYSSDDETPKVGDWVAVNVSPLGNHTIEKVVLRANEIARKVAGRQIRKQILAANIDVAFVLLALDNDFSVERVQRFLYQLSIHSITPVIVLNKADKTEDVTQYSQQLTQFDVPIIIAIAKDGVGIQQIKALIQPTQTALLLGSSGVGKSTLTNQLLRRDTQRVNTVRKRDQTGKHTTVHRELFLLDNGGILIDTPGIRELQLWGTEEELNLNFDDVTQLARQCQYTTCQHNDEEECAIKAALANGTLSSRHYEQYVKMQREVAALSDKKRLRDKADNARPRRYGDTRRAARKFDVRRED